MEILLKGKHNENLRCIFLNGSNGLDKPILNIVTLYGVNNRQDCDSASLLVLMVIHPFFFTGDREIQQARQIRPTLSRARVVWRLHLYFSSRRHNFDSIHVLCILYIKVHMYSRVVLIGTYRISYFLSASHWAFICSLSPYCKPAGVYSFAGVGVLSINNPHTHPSSSAGTIKIIRSVVNLGRSVHFRLQSEYGGR